MEQKLIVELEFEGNKVLGENNKGIDLKISDLVVAYIENDYTVARVISEEKLIEKKVDKKIYPIVRKITPQDIQRLNDNEKLAQEALKIMSSKVNMYKINIKIVSAKYNFSRSKLTVYYTAESHTDFRKFVKEMATRFKTKIQMTQLGPRDETKLLGGVGVCGNILCCKQWIKKFESISVEMAKTQQLSLNIPKLSGVCNRLKCCLQYEYDFYSECMKKMPKVGSKVKTPQGEGKVISVDCIKEKISVEIPLEEGNFIVKTFSSSEIEFSLVEKIKQSVGIEKK